MARKRKKFQDKARVIFSIFVRIFGRKDIQRAVIRIILSVVEKMLKDN